MDSNTIKRAATVMKVLRLRSTPGMDDVAVRLNMEPTYNELAVARAWSIAFEQCANSTQTVLEIAADMETGL